MQSSSDKGKIISRGEEKERREQGDDDGLVYVERSLYG
jgi:hypothetical protein